MLFLFYQMKQRKHAKPFHNKYKNEISFRIGGIFESVFQKWRGVQVHNILLKKVKWRILHFCIHFSLTSISPSSPSSVCCICSCSCASCSACIMVANENVSKLCAEMRYEQTMHVFELIRIPLLRRIHTNNNEHKL